LKIVGHYRSARQKKRENTAFFSVTGPSLQSEIAIMKSWNESDRVAALHRYEILDSASEADFSDFVQIASDICDVPIAAINLIDGNRHWSLAGIEHGDQELPLNRSICAHAILQSDLFVVSDLSVDMRFLDNPLVSHGPKLRFYAGAQLENPRGLPIGTVCVMDYKPRPNGLSARQSFTLKALARQIMAQLELRRAMLDITDGELARERLQASLHENEALLKAERKLRESECRYEATLSSIGDGVIATDDGGLITFMNPIAEVLTGWSKEEAIGEHLKSVYQVVNGETHRPSEGVVEQILSRARNSKTVDQALLVSRPGDAVPIDESGSPIIDDTGAVTGAVLVFSDTSDRRRAEEALRNARTDLARISRVTTMGQLTASIGHELNQPLMAVVMNAEACLKWLDDGNVDLGEARGAAGRVVSEGHRAGQIIDAIRSLARNAPVTFDTLEINSMIESMLAIVRTELRYRDLRVETNLYPGLLHAVGDRIQLQQVMLNLLSNAADAINASETQERRLAIASTMDELGEVRVSVEDSGTGIDPGIVDRIFNPFFTTKREGIGIGLSICRSIIDAHGGRLWAESQVPRGTRFCFVLPQCQL
jgi:PAS domain S-box-containing protein